MTAEKLEPTIAKKLSKLGHLGVHDGLRVQFDSVSGIKNVRAFYLSDILQSLGNDFHAQLQKEKIPCAVVSNEKAGNYYDCENDSMVLIGLGNLQELTT